MGVNLSPIVESSPIELSDLRGKTVAIDAYNTIFQFLSIIRQPDGKPLMDDDGMVTSHLSGLLYRTANLIENGIEPAFVFDGKPSELKAGTIEERIARREKAREEYFKNLKITAEVCIDRAENEDGLVPAASIIYSNVEDNLINKFGVRHEGGKFVMGYGEYLKAADSLSAPDGTFVLKRYNREKRCYVLVPPVIINTGREGGPDIVEMPPVIRFLNAGLNISAALQARDYWRFFNKIRHKAPESGAYLKDKFANFAQEKGYLVSALEFFKAHGLYTND